MGVDAPQHAKLVTLRIGEDDPTLRTLSNIDASRSQRDQTFYFLILLPVDRADVDVKPVFHGLRFGNLNENQCWRHGRVSNLLLGWLAIRDFNQVFSVLNHCVAKHRAPELRKLSWLVAVDDEFRESAGHDHPV